MNNVLSHYLSIFSERRDYLFKFYPQLPSTKIEQANDLELISNLFSASDFYDVVQKDLLFVYKRDNELDKNLFNFFFSIEKILKWSPFDSYHKFDETSYITQNEALEMLLNDSNFKASNKLHIMLDKAIREKTDMIFSFNESEWDSEFNGIYFSEIFLIFISFFFFDVIASDAQWFLFRCFFFQKDLDCLQLVILYEL